MIITDCHKELCEWANKGIFGYGEYDGKSKAIGLVLDDKLISAVTYSNFQTNDKGELFSCEMGIFSIDKRWCNRQYLRTVYEYPFAQLRLKRVLTVCSAEDEGVIMFNKRLGFKQEGLHRKGWFTGCDAISWGMLREDCKWLRS